jgi:DNA-binding transcriptional regulator YhcF (GntR family)
VTLNPSVERFYRWLKWRAGKVGQLFWRQEKMAEEFKVTVRTIQRWLQALRAARLIKIRRRSQLSAIIAIQDDRQLQFDFLTGCENQVENTVRQREDVASDVAHLSRRYKGINKSLREVNKTTAEPRRKAPPQETSQATTPVVTAVRELIGDYELGAFRDWRGNVLRAGQKPDALTLSRISRGLGSMEAFAVWRRRLVEQLRRDTEIGWGFVVWMARDVARGLMVAA